MEVSCGGNVSGVLTSNRFGGTDAAERKALAGVMHGAWASFARNGDPQHEGLPDWRPYTRPNRTTLRIGSVIEPVSDLAGLSNPKRPWPASIALPTR